MPTNSDRPIGAIVLEQGAGVSALPYVLYLEVINGTAYLSICNFNEGDGELRNTTFTAVAEIAINANGLIDAIRVLNTSDQGLYGSGAQAQASGE